jgi:hypothetical protein
MENAADIKAWCEEHWNDKGVINARDRNVFVYGSGGIAIKAGSAPVYKSKEQKAYEARFGIYNKKLKPIILAEANKSDASYMVIGDDKYAGPIYTWPKTEAPAKIEQAPAIPRKRVPKAKLEQAAAIIAKVPPDELATFLAKFGLSLSLAASIASLENAEMIARQFLRATL